MRVIRFRTEQGVPTTAAIADDGNIYLLPYPDFVQIIHAARADDMAVTPFVRTAISTINPTPQGINEVELLVPVEAPEVWAAGVTYERSREARNYEATQGKIDSMTCYDKVYDAPRPELFFKSTAARTVGPNGSVCLRGDSNWQIPEPELALVLSQSGDIIGYTIGNDMSCRDIEGENPLYLPQAKVWKQSCSIGPAIRLVDTGEDPYNLRIACRIFRGGEKVVEGTANTGQLKRTFEELVGYLTRDNPIFDGTVLLTGTCIVPPNDFTLQPGDRIEIEIDGIGVLVNPVATASP